jgi:hypothetical protein
MGKPSLQAVYQFFGFFVNQRCAKQYFQDFAVKKDLTAC